MFNNVLAKAVSINLARITAGHTTILEMYPENETTYIQPLTGQAITVVNLQIPGLGIEKEPSTLSSKI